MTREEVVQNLIDMVAEDTDHKLIKAERTYTDEKYGSISVDIICSDAMRITNAVDHKTAKLGSASGFVYPKLKPLPSTHAVTCVATCLERLRCSSKTVFYGVGDWRIEKCVGLLIKNTIDTLYESIEGGAAS